MMIIIITVIHIKLFFLYQVQVSLPRLKLSKNKKDKTDRETLSPTVTTAGQKQSPGGQLTPGGQQQQQQMMTAASSGGGKRVPIYHNAHKMFQVMNT